MMSDKIARLIAQVSGRMFVGKEMCSNQEWLAISLSYAAAMAPAMMRIKQWHPALRPFIYHFLPEYRAAVQHHEKAKRVLGPIIVARNKAEEEQGDKYQKPHDMLQVFLDNATPTQRKDISWLTNEQMSLAFAGLHTTAAVLLNVLYDLAARPEYLEPLREEVQEVLADNGGQFTKIGMEQLRKMDSFMKETMRFNPVNTGRAEGIKSIKENR